MNTKRFAVTLGILLSCLPVWAQEDVANETVQEALIKSLNSAGRKLIALAEATPAEDFSWGPSDQVRSISQVYMHVVGNNFQIPTVLGAEPPEGIDVPDRPYDRRIQKLGWEEEITQKEEVIGLLKKSLDYAAAAIPQVRDLDEAVTPLGFRDTKLNYLLLLVDHAHEHLGQSIAYARGAGVVPPWSQRPERAVADSVAVFEGDSARAEVVSIDRYGNLQTSLVEADLDRLGLNVGDVFNLTVGETSVEVFVGQTMMDVSAGDWFAVLNPAGLLTIGRSYENAAGTLSCEAGDPVVVRAAK